MRIWRLCKSKFAPTAFSGMGARLYGGRWSPKGLPVVYTAETPSLALLELLVHLDLDDAPPNCVLIPAEIPEDLAVTRWTVRDLPHDWNHLPHPLSTKEKGAHWVAAGRTAVLAVPSTVVPGERNFILNPAHPGFRRIKIGKPEEFPLDPRLWRPT